MFMLYRTYVQKVGTLAVNLIYMLISIVKFGPNRLPYTAGGWSGS